MEAPLLGRARTKDPDTQLQALVLADPDGPRPLGDALFAISGAMITSRKVCPHLCDRLHRDDRRSGFGERPGELSQPAPRSTTMVEAPAK